MSKCKIIFHQGWTDIIICLGIVFYNLERYNEVVLIIRKDSFEMCNYIFKNFKNLIIEYFEKEKYDVFIPILLNKYPEHKLFAHGGDFVSKMKNNIPYCVGDSNYFYQVFCTEAINANEFINSFKINREEIVENQFYNKLKNSVGNDYVIINEDPQRGLKIDRNKIKSNFPLFNINASTNIIFDAIRALENAKEIHTISTFWSMIIYILQKKYNFLINIPVYFHDYVRVGYYSWLYKDSGWIIL